MSAGHPALESRKYRENFSIWLYNIITAERDKKGVRLL